MLTSEFTALHLAVAFRGPAYAIIVYCGAQIAFRNTGTASSLIASKVVALWAVVFVALTAFGLAAVGAQFARGQQEIELGLCAYSLYINFGWHVFLMAAASMAVQVLVRDALRVRPAVHAKWSGMLIVAVVILAAWALDEAHTPFGPSPVGYSGMNGYGHHLQWFYTSGLCWTAFTLLAVLVAHLWIGRDGGDRKRWPVAMNIGVPTVVTWAAAGYWMYYDMLDAQANGTEPPVSPADHRGPFRSPFQRGVVHVVSMDLAVDLFPTERRLESRAVLLLANTGSRPIDELVLSFPKGARVGEIEFASAVRRSGENGSRRYFFERSLRPGERVRMRFELAWERRRLDDGGRSPGVIENGTFIEATDVVPSFGHGPRLSAAAVPATAIRMVIGTTLDQVAVGPGTLLREWNENARRYFEYSRSPSVASISPGFSIHSARYAVARNRYNDVIVEVYHHPGHRRNVGAMLRCVGRSLDRLAQRPAPYPDGLLRVIEFPYAGEMRVFPDAILFSERREFSFDLREGSRIDALCDSVSSAAVRQYEGFRARS